MGHSQNSLAPGVARFAETPLATVLRTLTGRWAVLALHALRDDHSHFNELQRRLDGISHKVLVDTLRALQRDGLVEGPLTCGATGYRLTPLGQELVCLVDEISQWAERRREEFGRRRPGESHQRGDV